jgi:hypothetical protein
MSMKYPNCCGRAIHESCGWQGNGCLLHYPPPGRVSNPHITPRGILDFTVGMWVRRKDSEGLPHGPILVVTGYNGRIDGKYVRDQYAGITFPGSICLSDGSWAFPGELFKGR